MLLLRLAQAAPEEGTSAFRVGGASYAAGIWKRGAPGIGVDDRRAIAHRRRCGWSDFAHGAGSIARMIHLPASVRGYLCLTACDMRKSFDGLDRKSVV